MNYALAILCTVGLYFLLDMWNALHTVWFHALGMNFTWFGVLFLAGVVVIGKVLIFNK